MQQHLRCVPTPGSLRGQCHHSIGHLAPVLTVPSSSDLTPTLPHLSPVEPTIHCATWPLFKLIDRGQGSLPSTRLVGKPLGEWYSSHARYLPTPPRCPHSLATFPTASRRAAHPLQSGGTGWLLRLCPAEQQGAPEALSTTLPAGTF